MAKTLFSNGTVVTSMWLNKVFGASGHIHDGADEDGSAPKIALTNAYEVTGVLPRANYVPPRGYIDGFQLAYAISGNAWNLEFGPGHCAMQNAAAGAATAAPATKKVINDAGTGFVSWAQGNYQGGVASGVSGPSNGQWLHAFVIRKSSSGAVDFGLDTSVTAANLIDTNWNEYRRVGSIQIVSLQGGKYGIRRFKQFGDEFLWEVAPIDYSAVAVPYQPDVLTMTLTVPPAIRARARLGLAAHNNTTAWQMQYWDGPLGPTFVAANGGSINGAASDYPTSTGEVMTDENRRAYAAEVLAATGTTLLDVTVRGYLDPRGKQ